MYSILSRSFGGLRPQYYFRQWIFGLIFTAILVFLSSQADVVPFKVIVIFIINTFLYPYSRFVYESVLNFFLGENIFIVNFLALMIFKLITMILCWGMAILIAPFGLIYLYFVNSKFAKEINGE